MVNHVRRRSHDHSNRRSAKDTRVKPTRIAAKMKAAAKPHNSMEVKATSKECKTIRVDNIIPAFPVAYDCEARFLTVRYAASRFSTRVRSDVGNGFERVSGGGEAVRGREMLRYVPAGARMAISR